MLQVQQQKLQAAIAAVAVAAEAATAKTVAGSMASAPSHDQLQKLLERQHEQDKGQNESVPSDVLAAVTVTIADLQSFVSKELAGVKSRIDEVERVARATSGTARQLNRIEQQFDEVARIQEDHRTNMSQIVIEALELEQEARGSLAAELQDLRDRMLPVLEAQQASGRLRRGDYTMGNKAALFAQLESTVSTQVHSKTESVTSMSVDEVLSCDLGLPVVTAPLALKTVHHAASEVGGDLMNNVALERRCGSSRSHTDVRTEASVVSSAPTSLGNNLAAASNIRATLPCRSNAQASRGSTPPGISLKGDAQLPFARSIIDRATVPAPLLHRRCMTSRALHDHTGHRVPSCDSNTSPPPSSVVRGGIPDLSRLSRSSSTGGSQYRGLTFVPMSQTTPTASPRLGGTRGLQIPPQAQATFRGVCHGSIPATGVAVEGD